MKETKELLKLYEEFEIKFGFNLLNDLKLLMSRIYQKMNNLEESRDRWKEKYFELKNSNNI